MKHTTYLPTTQPIASLFSSYGLGLPVSEHELDRAVDLLAAMKAARPSDEALNVMAAYVGKKLCEGLQQEWLVGSEIQ